MTGSWYSNKYQELINSTEIPKNIRNENNRRNISKNIRVIPYADRAGTKTFEKRAWREKWPIIIPGRWQRLPHGHAPFSLRLTLTHARSANENLWFSKSTTSNASNKRNLYVHNFRFLVELRARTKARVKLNSRRLTKHWWLGWSRLATFGVRSLCLCENLHLFTNKWIRQQQAHRLGVPKIVLVARYIWLCVVKSFMMTFSSKDS
jgi:hypothetical protein